MARVFGDGAVRGVLMLLVVTLVGCDHATKVVATISLPGASRVIVPGLLELVYTENRNIAFSLFHQLTSPAKGPLILAMSFLAIAAIAALWWKRWREARLVEHAAFALVVVGALGRLQRGYVVDFIHVLYWPVFNVADIAVCAGGALVLLTMMRTSSPSPVVR
jgi:signal peptidase II